VRCYCSEATLKKRILSRGEARDSWKLKHWDDFISEQPQDVQIPFEHIDINTELELRGNLDKIMKFLLPAAQLSIPKQRT
jgi:hypothetical protein